jgi:stearoyl-CoA desaturase (delta-9 desaturase)
MGRGGPAGFNWPTGLFIIGYHVALIVGLPFYFAHNSPGLPLIAISIVLLVLTEIGIGAAYHRFYAHRAYKMRRPAEAVLLFFGTLATQGDVLRWSFEHRRHHSFSDTDDDPYSIKQGFWYAHVLWLFEKGRPIDPRWVKDLTANPLVMFQHRYNGLLTFGGNALVAGLVGWAVGDFLGAFVLAWWTRLAVSHHLTWFVNSLCHYWGERTYSKELSAVDNYVLAVMTVGEGYHNYHHTFPSDYRNGVRWYHIDPNKWTIWLLSKIGMARDLKRINRDRIERRLLREDRQLLVDHLEQSPNDRYAELKSRVEQLSTRIQEALARRGALLEKLEQLKQAGLDRHARRMQRKAHRRQLRSLRQDLKRDWRAWHELCGAVLVPQRA